MSEVVSAPAPSLESTSPAAPETAAPVLSRSERALSVLKKGAQLSLPGTDPVKTEAATETPPEKPKEEKPAPDLSAHAKALALAQRKEREAFEANKRAQTLEAELAQERSKQEARKKLSPLEVLKQEYGLDYAGLTKAIVENKFAEKTPEQEALSAHDQELKSLKEKIDAYEAKEQQAQAAQIRTANLEYIANEIKSKAQDYALVAALPGDHIGAIYARIEQMVADGHDPDVHGVISSYEKAAQADVDALFASDAVLMKFLSSPDVKTRVMNLMGLTKPTPQPDQQASRSRTALPHQRAQDPGSRSTPIREASSKSRVERALEAVAQKRRTV